MPFSDSTPASFSRALRPPKSWPFPVLLGLLMLAAAGVSRAAVVSVERVSVSTGGAQAVGGQSLDVALSPDGRFAAFDSSNLGLVPGDTNGTNDIFVRDRLVGTTERVSVFSGGGQSGAGSHEPSIGGDGTITVFTGPSNLVAGGNGAAGEVFAHNRLSNETERVSQSTGFPGEAGNLDSFRPEISTNGQFVVFGSWANNLVPGDTNVHVDFFVRDRLAHTTERVSVAHMTAAEGAGGTDGLGGGGIVDCDISADGRFVAFRSTFNNLVAGDTNGRADVFVRDRMLGTTERVSVTTAGVQGTGNFSGGVSISGDGNRVAFETTSRLAPGDTDFDWDIYVRERSGAGVTRLVSVSSAGAQSAFECVNPAISEDGSTVVFTSPSSDLVPGDTNARQDVFIHSLETGVTERVSENAGGAQANDTSGGFVRPAISENGSLVGFPSSATNLVFNPGTGLFNGDTNGAPDAFVVTHSFPGPPVANAGSDQAVAVLHDGTPVTNTAPVTLMGTATDPNGGALTFEWRDSAGNILTPPGGSANVMLNLTAGVREYTLKVTDSGGLFDEDDVEITVLPEPNQTPVANAGPNQAMITPTAAATVQLDGSASADPDGDVLAMDKYKWFESGVQIAEGTTPIVELAIGNHILTLEVSDAYGAAGTDSLAIDVQPSLTLSGLVIYRGIPVPGLGIGTDRPGYEAFTNSSGQYQITGLEPGSIFVTPRVPITGIFTFDPPNATINLTANTTQDFAMRGTGGNGRLLRRTIDCGPVRVGSSRTRAIIIRNQTQTPVGFLIQPAPAPFVLKVNNVSITRTSWLKLSFRESITLSATFTPTARGRVTRGVQVITSDERNPMVVLSLRGTGR